MKAQRRHIAALLLFLGVGSIIYLGEAPPSLTERARSEAALEPGSCEAEKLVRADSDEPPLEAICASPRMAVATPGVVAEADTASRGVPSSAKHEPRPDLRAPRSRAARENVRGSSALAFARPQVRAPQEPSEGATTTDEGVRAPDAEPALAPSREALEITPPPTSPVVGHFQNRVGDYDLERVTCALDGRTVYSGPAGRDVALFQRGVSPGVHHLSVSAEYRAKSAGIFTYTRGFRVTVQRARRFNVDVGEPASITIAAFERGGPTEPLQERLALAVAAR